MKILLMIIGHSQLPHLLTNLIFSFHMPLFFLISGFLYKDRKLKDLLSRNSIKILLPYLITGLIICGLKAINGNYLWAFSLILANGSRPVFNLTDYYVGPLWFLISYLVSLIFFHYIKKIDNIYYQFAAILLLWTLSFGVTHYINMLPFGIIPAISGTLFMLIGNYIHDIKNSDFSHTRYLIIGLVIWICCIFKGNLSMASNIYRLYILQIIGALYGTYVFYKILLATTHKKELKALICFIGRSSLFILCIHSIDWNMGYSTEFTNYLISKGIITFHSIDILFKLSFTIIIFVLFYKIPLIQKIYNIQ